MTDTPLQQPSPQQPPRTERRGNRQPPKPQSPLYRALTGVCLVGSLAALVPAAQMAVAGLASYRTETTLLRWQASGQVPADVKWQHALRAAQLANAWYPVASGTYLEQLGQVYSWRAFDQPVGAQSAHESRLLAAAAYRHSARARPTWPTTWAHLAQSKYALGEVDNEFAQALKQANEWGPSRPDVQLELASIGLRAWPLLNHQQRVDAVTSARQAMDSTKQAANSLFAIAQANGLEQTLCTSVGDSNGARNYCTRGGNQ